MRGSDFIRETMVVSFQIFLIACIFHAFCLLYYYFLGGVPGLTMALNGSYMHIILALFFGSIPLLKVLVVCFLKIYIFTLCARRLHDIGGSALWLLPIFFCLPFFFFAIFFLYFLTKVLLLSLSMCRSASLGWEKHYETSLF